MSHTINQAYGFISKPSDNSQILLVEELDGTWSIPGGAVEESDEGIVAGLKRELNEELGLTSDEYKVTETQIQVSFLYDRPGGSRYGKTGVIDMFYIQLNEGVLPVAQDEHIKSTIWCTQKESKARLQFAQHHELIDRGFEFLESIQA